MLSRYESTRTFAVTSTILGLGFLLGALTHAIGWVPFGALSDEPRIVSSALIEFLCGGLILAAAIALGAHRAGAWRGALGAHAVALVAVLVGMISVSLGFGWTTETSTVYHAVMLALLVLNTIGLWRARPRNPIKRAQHEIAARLY
jgi:hypothetical protein